MISMKKLNLFIAATLVAASSLFTSCSKDATNFPTINTFSASPTTAEAGDTVTVSIKVSPGDKDIKYITILSSATGAAAYDVASNKSWSGDKDALGYYNKSGIYTTTATFIFPSSGSSVTYTCVAYDTDGNASSASTVTVSLPAAPTITGTLTTVKTGAVLNTVTADGSSASCCASATGSVYSVTTATSTYQSVIDFVYFNGNGTSELNNTIYSPATAASSSVTTVNSLFANWTPLNATKFAKVTAFDASSVATALASPSTKVSVSNGDNIAFKTAGGVYGVLTITAVGTAESWGGNSTITATIKTFQ
jgi:hypothetical protein